MINSSAKILYEIRTDGLGMVLEISKKEKISMQMAAYCLAVDRVAQATQGSRYLPEEDGLTYAQWREIEMEEVDMRKMKRALMSVSDKSGVVELAKALADLKVEILSTGGTAKILRENGIQITEVSDYTGFPEMLDGRVKTLHPKIHGGILGQRENPEHLNTMAKHGIEGIDMVVVNLYPFEATVAKPDCTLEEAFENIDIGGPAMIRSAAKNYRDVTVVVDPGDYEDLIAELGETGGQVSIRTRFRLARKVFQTTAKYDGAISNYLSTVEGDG